MQMGFRGMRVARAGVAVPRCRWWWQSGGTSGSGLAPFRGWSYFHG